MAKAPKNSASGINLALLTQVMQASDQGQNYFVSQAEGMPLIQHDPKLIDVNTGILDPTDNSKAAARITDAGRAFLTNQAVATNTNPYAGASVSSFAIITNAIPPQTKKRGGGGGAPVMYPFDDLQMGGSFFVPSTAKRPDPVKSLQSTISAQTLKYATQTGTRQAERTKRGEKNRAVKDENGNSVKEMATVPVYKLGRKFIIRKVEAGVKYGDWVAPENGALITRVEVSASE